MRIDRISSTPLQPDETQNSDQAKSTETPQGLAGIPDTIEQGGLPFSTDNDPFSNLGQSIENAIQQQEASEIKNQPNAVTGNNSAQTGNVLSKPDFLNGNSAQAGQHIDTPEYLLVGQDQDGTPTNPSLGSLGQDIQNEIDHLMKTRIGGELRSFTDPDTGQKAHGLENEKIQNNPDGQYVYDSEPYGVPDYQLANEDTNQTDNASGLPPGEIDVNQALQNLADDLQDLKNDSPPSSTTPDDQKRKF